MVIQDKILRWIDQPVVITSHTDGETVPVIRSNWLASIL